MSDTPRPPIYREWWIFPFMLAIAGFPWFQAAEIIGPFVDRPRAWALFVGSFGAALGLAAGYCFKLHRDGRLFPGSKQQAEKNRARTMTSRSYWPLWVGVGVAIVAGPSSLQLVGLGILSGTITAFIPVFFLNAIRVPPIN